MRAGFIAKSSPLSGKPMLAPSKPAMKRAFAPSTYEDADCENVDPNLFSPSKKSKSDTSDGFVKPYAFSLSNTKSMPPPPFTSRLATPARANTSSPRTPLTAPAGRSPGRKQAGISKNRRVSAPFTRVDPPFGTRGSSTLPFSLDSVLQTASMGTKAITKTKPSGKTIQEEVPDSWEFTIYEDTPEEEAQNLMEHSALTLDLSSDDETTIKKTSFRGKENTPPEGYSAQAASRAASATTLGQRPSSAIEPTTAPRRQFKTDYVRTKVTEMDDGERSPLSALEVDEFIPEGITKDDKFIVDASPEKAKVESEGVYSAPPPTFSFSKFHKSQTSSAAKTDVNADGDIVVFEDSHNGGIEGTAPVVAAEEEAGESAATALA